MSTETEQPTDAAREAAEQHIRIYTKCPACHNDTLTICDKHLLCTWITCPDPTLIDRHDTTAALRREVEGLKAERDKAQRIAAENAQANSVACAGWDRVKKQRDESLAQLATVTKENERLTKYGDGLRLAVEGYEEKLGAVTKERDESTQALYTFQRLCEEWEKLADELKAERDTALARAEAGEKARSADRAIANEAIETLRGKHELLCSIPSGPYDEKLRELSAVILRVNALLAAIDATGGSEG